MLHFQTLDLKCDMSNVFLLKLEVFANGRKWKRLSLDDTCASCKSPIDDAAFNPPEKDAGTADIGVARVRVSRHRKGIMSMNAVGDP